MLLQQIIHCLALLRHQLVLFLLRQGAADHNKLPGPKSVRQYLLQSVLFHNLSRDAVHQQHIKLTDSNHQIRAFRLLRTPKERASSH